MTYKLRCFSNGQRYLFFISLNVAFLMFIRVTYIYLLKCVTYSSVINKQENSTENEWKEMKYMSQKRILQVFDYGLQFEVSYSPLYKTSSLFKNTSNWNFYPRKRVSDVDCSQLFEQNPRNIENVLQTPVVVCLKSKDCEEFITTRGYIMDPLSDEEANFPIAFSILVYKTPDQFEILFRAIYRPQNVYCVHTDNKTTGSDLNEFECITRCFPNVFLATNRVEVTWGKIGVLSAELSCMKDLLSFKKWKYFINLTGQEFPLRTNYELVQILKIYNGSNDAEGTIKRANRDRWEKADAAPHGINPVKGSVHVTLNRKFVEYVINSRIAKDFLRWVNKTDIPDETYFATLIHNPQLGIPGSFRGELETDFGEKKPFLSRFKNWQGAPNALPCHGKYVRSICVFGVKDLPLLARRPEFFANKFHFDFHRQALYCMDELIFNRTREEYEKNFIFDTHYYTNLKHIRNIVKK